MKKVLSKKSQIIFWKNRNFLNCFKKSDLLKYVPVRVLLLVVFIAIIFPFIQRTDLFSGNVFGSESNFEFYSDIKGDLNSDSIIKNIGRLEDWQLALVSSKQCDLDYQKGQSSDLCGAKVKNELLKEQEKKEEQVRLAAERAREAARRLAAAKASARMPASFAKDSLGRLVCDKKNDKPGKSKENNKGKIHMDMECCLDPDEYPNPHCYYDPGKYGKYFK
jgi:hypothetical protein